MAFAEKLKIIRKQAGMSQEQLAEKLGVSRQAVTKWETDAGIPDIQPKGWYLVFLLYFSNLILHLRNKSDMILISNKY